MYLIYDFEQIDAIRKSRFASIEIEITKYSSQLIKSPKRNKNECSGVYIRNQWSK